MCLMYNYDTPTHQTRNRPKPNHKPSFMPSHFVNAFYTTTMNHQFISMTTQAVEAKAQHHKLIKIQKVL